MLVHELNEREREIIALLAEGLANKEIANRLFIAPNTVKWYIKHINNKLGTSNRDEIVAIAQKSQILQPPNPAKAQYERPKSNLPRPSTAFVGRDKELEELHKLLANPDFRLINILAAGGMGKTRLALEAAERQRENFKDGIFFVPLQAISTSQEILSSFADSLSYYFQTDGRSPKSQLLDFLANKEILLLTDNWEHLLADVGLLNEILEAAPRAKILATSREKLQLMGETVYVLRGMEFPTWESPADALEYDAVQLLIQAARRANPDWQLTDANLTMVARICRLTQGMPLGILLAVSWLDMLTLEEIAAEIQSSTDFLQAHFADVPERQQSIRAIFNYSWNRLDDSEKSAFMSLSIFRGGFSREAAKEVAGATLPILHRLLDKALVLRVNAERYDLHELLRQYAEEKLQQSGQESKCRDKHCRYFLQFATDIRAHQKDQRQKEAVTIIANNFENIRAAWLWAVETEAIDLLVESSEAIWFYGDCAFTLRDAYVLFSAATAKLIADNNHQSLAFARLRLTEALACTYTATTSEEQALAKAYCEEALRIAECESAQYELYFGKMILAQVMIVFSQFEEAAQIADETLVHAQILNIPYYLADAYQFIAYINSYTSRWREMRDAIEKAYAMFKQIGDPNRTAGQLRKLGEYYWRLCEFDKAENHLREALAIREDLCFWGYSLMTATDLARVLFNKGDFDEAEALFYKTYKTAQDLGFESALAMSLIGLSKIFAARGEYLKSLEIIRHLYQVTKLDRQHLRAGILILPLGLNQQFDEMREETRLFLQTFPKHYAEIPNIQFSFIFEFLALLYQDWGVGRVTEILSALLHHPLAPPYLARHAYTRQAQAAWQAALGDEAFARAWERGKTPDLDKLCLEILNFYQKQ